MKPAVREWVEKAEADYRVALRESRVRVLPSPEAACFHAQQCVEKYFKAVLVDRGQTAPRVHDLELLWRMVGPLSPILKRRVAGLASLSLGAVEYRYPGRRLTRSGARKSVATMKVARSRARSALGIP